ncbi:MAG: dihydrofolate reductase [Candidatus Paceibacteria bacterium]|jgi:dihydrofolate reductase
MSTTRISAIAAIGRNRELGAQGDLIWRISNDLKRVRDLTTGHAIVMGRKTYESIGRALPNRLNIVVSRDPHFEAPGCTVVSSVEEAITVGADAASEVFVFGGAAIYEAALPSITRLYVTYIDAEYPTADVYFPAYNDFSVEIEHESHLDETIPYVYRTLERPAH